MFCKYCGAKLEDNAAACVNCNAKTAEPTQVYAPKQQVTTYLLPAILITLLCCLPFGIVAIVYAAQASGKVAAGDIQGAMDSSRKAKMWCWTGLFLGLVSTIAFYRCFPTLSEMLKMLQD